MTTAAQLIRDLREKAGLSQAEVALGVGKSDGAVSQWETGRALPRREIAFKLDKLLAAEGQVVHALGYALPSDRTPHYVDDVLAQQAELRASMETEISQLRALVGELAVRILRLETQADTTTERVHDLMERVLLPDVDERPSHGESRTAL